MYLPRVEARVAAVPASPRAARRAGVSLCAAAWLCAAAALAPFSGAGAAAAASDTRTFADVPRVTVGDAAFFRGLLESARSEPLRVAFFGDSQETAPSGFGEHYLAFLNARFSRVFGPAGETILFTNATAVDPPQWLATVAASTALGPVQTTPAETPPNIVVHALRAAKADRTRALRVVFLDDAARASDPSLVGGPWFTQGVPVRAEVVVRRGGLRGALRWWNAPTDGDAPDPSAPSVASGTLSFPPETKPGAFATLATPPLDLAGRRHVQLELLGVSDKSPQEVVGVRFRAVGGAKKGAGGGVVLQSLARGGMRLGDLAAEHAESGAMLAAIGPRLAVLHYGANDAAAAQVTREAWRDQLAATVAWLRGALGDPAFPVIIAAELPLGGSILAAERIDWMPVVAHDLALADPRILALNLRRIADEEYGWGRTSMFHLVDTAHFQPYAQRLEAEAFVGELCAALAIDDPACSEPSWADCVRRWGARCASGGCREIIDVEAEEFGLGWGGVGSTCDDGDGDGSPDLCPPGGIADINRDGFVDGQDLAFVLADWGAAGGVADLDGDGFVGAADLAIVLGAWGK